MKTQRLFVDGFTIKVIALLTMTLSHIAIFLTNQGHFLEGSPGFMAGVVMQYIGRLSFPLFAFLLAEGLHKTHDRSNYILRLALLAVACLLGSAVIYWVDNDIGSQISGNAFLDLTLFALVIYLFENKRKSLRFLALLPLGYILLSFAMDFSEAYAYGHNMTSVWSASYPLFLRSAYNLYGFLIFLGYYYALPLAKGSAKKMTQGDKKTLEEFEESGKIQGLSNTYAALFLVFLNLIFWMLAKFGVPDPYFMGAQSYAALSALPIIFYNGKRGFDNKPWRYFTYLYYPVHLVLIWGIFALIFR